MKQFIYQCYWIFAGLLVGAMSIFLGYANLNLILQDSVMVDGNIQNAFSVLGCAQMMLEYVVVIFTLSLVQKLFKTK